MKPITTELLVTAEELASLGLSMKDVCRGLGVSAAWLYGHLKAAREGRGTPEEVELLNRINGGQAAGTRRLVESLRKSALEGDPRSATWLLSHSPASRRDWSEAGAVLKERRQIISTVCEAIEASNLGPGTTYRLLLECEARGLGSMRIAGEDLDELLADEEPSLTDQIKEQRQNPPAAPDEPGRVYPACKLPSVVITPGQAAL